MGGGCGLALACDLRVGDRSAKMGIPAARLGIINSALDCGLLHRQVVLANAKRVLYEGRPFDFDECLRMGLLGVSVDIDALDGAQDLASSLAANAPMTLKVSKVILDACQDCSAAARSAEIKALIESGLTSADYTEGRTAFLRKEHRLKKAPSGKEE